MEIALFVDCTDCRAGANIGLKYMTIVVFAEYAIECDVLTRHGMNNGRKTASYSVHSHDIVKLKRYI